MLVPRRTLTRIGTGLARPSAALHPHASCRLLTGAPARHQGHLSGADIGDSSHDEFWRKVPRWRDVPASDFLSYRFSVKHVVERLGISQFLQEVLPDRVPFDNGVTDRTQARDELIDDVLAGARRATMSIRITPYLLSRVDWNNPRNDPIFRQFVPLGSVMRPDHPSLELDSLHEVQDSPVQGLVHRYPDKALFLAMSVCPTYCTFCTRAHEVGANTETVTKTSQRPGKRRWQACFDYIRSRPELSDIVISGGDAFQLTPGQLHVIADELIGMDNVRRFRFASKGLAVAPGRFLDRAEDNDGWAQALVEIASKAKKAGKSMALHTHFNHPNEISWVTRLASQRLLEEGVTVRNQTVLLRGINDDVGTMSRLIRGLADINIIPYYVYMCDMVKNSEHKRTPLQTSLDLESQIRGSIAGFMMPQFIVDLPRGGGKRLSCSYTSYDRKTGISTFKAPAVMSRGGMAGKPELFHYHDPLPTHEETGEAGLHVAGYTHSVAAQSHA